MQSLQCVVDFENTDQSILNKINTGTSIEIEGTLVESQGKGQKIEVQTEQIKILGECDPEIYPIQPKKHSLEFLRENAHLRARTNTFGAVFRVRSSISFAIHKYFKDNGFVYVNTPIVTGSDAEGAGEMLKVTTLDLNKADVNDKNEIDFSKDFLEKKLTLQSQVKARGRKYGYGSGKSLLRTNFQGRKFEHIKTFSRILDD